MIVVAPKMNGLSLLTGFPQKTENGRDSKWEATQLNPLNSHENRHGLIALITRIVLSPIQLMGEIYSVLESSLKEPATVPEVIQTVDKWVKRQSNLDKARIAQQSIIRFLEDENQMELSLVGLDLSSLPNIFGANDFVTRLQKLNLAHNQLETLPRSIGKLQSLQSLSLSFNQLTVLPESIFNLENLQTLGLIDNQLTWISKNIRRLRALRELYLQENQLRELPQSIGDLQALEELDLTRNELITLPKEIGDLRTLRRLVLACNRLIQLPERIARLPNLQTIHLQFNQLKNLPVGIVDLQSLENLHVDDNQYPPEKIINNLEVLQILSPEYREILSRWIEEQVGRETQTQIFLERLVQFLEEENQTELILRDVQLPSLPDIFADNSFSERLKRVDITRKQLLTLPNSIGKQKTLQDLYLKYNQLSSFGNHSYEEKIIRACVFIPALTWYGAVLPIYRGTKNAISWAYEKMPAVLRIAEVALNQIERAAEVLESKIIEAYITLALPIVKRIARAERAILQVAAEILKAVGGKIRAAVLWTCTNLIIPVIERVARAERAVLKVTANILKAVGGKIKVPLLWIGENLFMPVIHRIAQLVRALLRTSGRILIAAECRIRMAWHWVRITLLMPFLDRAMRVVSATWYVIRRALNRGGQRIRIAAHRVKVAVLMPLLSRIARVMHDIGNVAAVIWNETKRRIEPIWQEMTEAIHRLAENALFPLMQRIHKVSIKVFADAKVLVTQTIPSAIQASRESVELLFLQIGNFFDRRRQVKQE